jgi:hypothetical protein
VDFGPFFLETKIIKEKRKKEKRIDICIEEKTKMKMAK